MLRVAWCLLIVGAVCCGPSAARAQILKQAESLQGHESVYVLAEIPKDDRFAPLGLKEESIREFVTKRLQAGGIKIVEKPGEASLVLVVSLDLMRANVLYPFSVRLSGCQWVRVSHNQRAMFLPTWTARWFGVVGKSSVGNIRKSVEQMVDRFIEDWKTAHKPAGDPFKGKKKAASEAVTPRHPSQSGQLLAASMRMSSQRGLRLQPS